MLPSAEVWSSASYQILWVNIVCVCVYIYIYIYIYIHTHTHTHNMYAVYSEDGGVSFLVLFARI